MQGALAQEATSAVTSADAGKPPLATATASSSRMTAAGAPSADLRSPMEAELLCRTVLSLLPSSASVQQGPLMAELVWQVGHRVWTHLLHLPGGHLPAPFDSIYCHFTS